ncbi:MAG: iron ABC transporter permease [Verrucomicrobiota bacterium]
MSFSWTRAPWAILCVLTAVIVSSPLLTIIYYWLLPSTQIWEHLVSTVLKSYVVNSLLLAAGVFLLSSIIGTSLAWVTSRYNFRGTRTIEWLSVLPLAFPTYIIGFTYAELLNYLGPIQTVFRELFGIQSKSDYWFPDIMTLPGAIILMSFVLYPYVYLIVKPVFENQSLQLEQTAKTLGCSKLKLFYKISLPQARPAIIAGASLALMEALNDFGTVSYFGIPTFTTGIYRTWFNLGDLSAAARLSSLLVIFVFTILLVEQLQRRHIHQSINNSRGPNTSKKRLRGLSALVIPLVCLLPFFLGFFVPALQLLSWAVARLSVFAEPDFYLMACRSFGLALSVAFIITAIAFILRYTSRILQKQAPVIQTTNRLSTLGYAIPGSVISVSILIPLAFLDHRMNDLTKAIGGWSVGLVFSGSLLALGYGYVVRFLAVGYNAIDAGFSNIANQLCQTSFSLGHGPLRTLFKIHLPLARGSILAAVILVMVDILKELPATLILRPFNFDTLATRTYELAIEEQLPEASIYALTIVLLGLAPIFLLTKMMNTVSNSEGHQ